MPVAIREKIASLPEGYLMKWCFRIHCDQDITAIYNDTYLLAIKTGVPVATAALIAPYNDTTDKHRPVIVFKEKGTRRITKSGHKFQGWVINEETAPSDLSKKDLLNCDPGTSVLTLDGTDSQLKGWLAVMVLSATESLRLCDLGKHRPLQFLDAWLVCSTRSESTVNKHKRGFTGFAIPANHEFVMKGPRKCLDFSQWYGSGVIAFEPSTATGWYFNPKDENDMLIIKTETTEVRLG